jgi:ABC-type transporter Mla subunit MlaD
MSPPRPSVPWRVGALVVISAGVLLAVLVLAGPLRVFRGSPVAVDFGYAGPIKPGAAVRLSGVVVGAVERVELLAGQDPAAGPDVMVRVHARVEDRAWPVVTPSARFFVTTLGVLGEHYLDLQPAAPPRGESVERGAVLRGIDLARPDLLLPRAAALLEVMGAVLDEGRDEALNLMRAAARLVQELDRLLGEGEGLAAPLLEEARALMADARQLADGLRAAVGDGRELRGALERMNRLGRKVEDSDLLEQAQQALRQLNQAPLLAPERQLRLLGDLETTLRAVDDLSGRAAKLLDQLDRGEGALGKAFQDEQLVDDLRSVLHQLRTNPYRLLVPSH